MVHACAEGFHFLLVFLGNFVIILSNSFPASVCVCLSVCLQPFSSFLPFIWGHLLQHSFILPFRRQVRR